jgi:hypothetical protein
VREQDITDIFVQVVVGGYAYYNSDILPRSQYLSKISGADYDPLDSLVRAFANTPVRIHAWVNTLLCWSLSVPPDSPDHVLHKHPDWFINDINNQSMADYTYTRWKNANLEGLYLDPANPAVNEFVEQICSEIASNYPVDGIHLDFIRYPGIMWGLLDNDETAVLAGIDADVVSWCSLVRYGRLEFIQRWQMWHAWRLTADRQWVITRIINNMSQALKRHASKAKCELSTAVFANPALSHYSFAQYWTEWQDDIFFPVVMSYTPNIDLFTAYMGYAMFHRPDALMGIGLLWPSMKHTAKWQEDKVRNSNGAGVCYFDFTSVDTMSSPALREFDSIPQESLFIDSGRHEPLVDIFTDLPDSSHVAMGRKMMWCGSELGFAAFLLSLSLDPLRDLTRMGLSREAFLDHILQDAAAFTYLDQQIFPIGDMLVTPPTRSVRYTFLSWLDDDSLTLVEKAHRPLELEQHAVLYPSAGDPFTKAAFVAQQSSREVLLAPSGIYVFVVDSICGGGTRVARADISSELLPTFINWTIKTRVAEILASNE